MRFMLRLFGGRFDVIEGRKVNDAPLSKEQAEALASEPDSAPPAAAGPADVAAGHELLQLAEGEDVAGLLRRRHVNLRERRSEVSERLDSVRQRRRADASGQLNPPLQAMDRRALDKQAAALELELAGLNGAVEAAQQAAVAAESSP